MAYIKSEEHFINFINRVISENPEIDENQLLDSESYIDFIYSKKLTDTFTWGLKENPRLLEENNLLVWLQKYNSTGLQLIPSNLENILTAEFSDEIKKLKHISGVYSFWSKSKIPLYVGVSIDIQTRAISSFSERFNKYKKEVYFRYISTITATDAAVLEVYFIGKLKPSLNGASKYSDNLTLKLITEPEFSNPILCNRIRKIKTEGLD